MGALFTHSRKWPIQSFIVQILDQIFGGDHDICELEAMEDVGSNIFSRPYCFEWRRATSLIWSICMDLYISSRAFVHCKQ